METQAFEGYLKQVRELVLQNQNGSQPDNHELLSVIEEQKTNYAGDSSFESFFNGEHHFYNGCYEQALKCYLEAKDVPCFQFFCYRASSLISKERGQPEKALSYIQKAFKLDSDDPTVQQLFTSLRSAVEVNGEESNKNGQLASGEAYPLFENSGGNQFYDTNSYQEIPRKNPVTTRKSENFTATSTDEFQENHALKKRINLFQNTQLEQMQAYLKQGEQHLELLDNSLYILNGWNLAAPAKPFLFTEESRKSSGGHYLRWNGKGIAINPGANFLENFHAQGFCVRDIDFVLVTRNSKDAYADVRAISELCQQVNRVASDRQIIHYYLHQRVCQELAPFLKPSFKQARNTIHKLEMFLDSPDVEKVELSEGIVLHYFMGMTSQPLHGYRENLGEHTLNSSSLGIRFELANETQELKVGYLSGLAWSPLLIHHLGYCDLLLAGFGNTNYNDYSRLEFTEDSLGYSGCSTVLEELAPKLLLLTEFAGREGDIRIEVIKKMRSDCYQDDSHQTSALLPADVGLTVDLNNLHVKCSISKKFVPAGQTHVVAGSNSFGRLSYLSPHFCA
ncbi:MAG: hypothetical protein H0T62_02105 [Parachlamydiaceae bacterium]|nr:hypothetical protein [Parachlamydiaceae bacterium]